MPKIDTPDALGGWVGPMARRLQSFGELQTFVVGNWGEGSEDLHALFLHPKSLKMAVWVQKNGTLDAQIKKRRPLFVTNYPQKWWNRLLFHKNIIFGRVLGKF